MKKIKIYDIDAFLKSNNPEYKPFRYEKAAIFEGQYGFVFAEEEAVHQRVTKISDEVRIPLCKRPSPGHISIMSCGELIVSLDEIVAGAPCDEKTLEEFFHRRNYNPRCQNNYATLMASLRNIGFDLHGYFEDKPSIEEQIREADDRKHGIGEGHRDSVHNVER